MYFCFLTTCSPYSEHFSTIGLIVVILEARFVSCRVVILVGLFEDCLVSMSVGVEESIAMTIKTEKMSCVG